MLIKEIKMSSRYWDVLESQIKEDRKIDQNGFLGIFDGAPVIIDDSVENYEVHWINEQT